MPRFKSIISYYNSPKIKLFLQKNAKFSSDGGSVPRPLASGGWGLRPQTPKIAPPMRISGYAPDSVDDFFYRYLFCHENN